MIRAALRERYISIRIVAFVAALTFHVPLLFVARIESRDRLPPASAIMQARFIEPSVTRAMPPVTHDRPTPQRAPRAEEIPRLQQSIQPTQPTQSEAPPVDWHAAGEQSVTGAVASIIREESYRPLGPHEKRSYELPPVPSLFRAPKHKFGDVDEDPLGRTAVWHNERCYTTLEEPITPRASADIPGVNPMKCLWLRKKPRGNLFDHLRRDAR